MNRLICSIAMPYLQFFFKTAMFENYMRPNLTKVIFFIFKMFV